jgi:hypothetical protein
MEKWSLDKGKGVMVSSLWYLQINQLPTIEKEVINVALENFIIGLIRLRKNQKRKLRNRINDVYLR